MFRALLVPVCFGAFVMTVAAAAAAPRPGDAADRPLVRVAGEVTIEAPWSVDPGQKLDVSVAGGVPGGQLQIWGPVNHATTPGRLLASGAATGGSVPVTAPNVPASYELRYVGPSGQILAKRSFEVAAVPVRLWVPEAIGSGLPVDIRWRGPARPGDFIQIVDPARGAVVSEAAAEGQPGAENVTRLTAPQQGGDYEVRYVAGAEGAVLRTLPVTVGRGRTWMRSPALVNTGESFRVEWFGPVEPDHRFQIVNAAGSAVVTARPDTEGEKGFARFTAPPTPGRYRMRYVNAATGQVHSDLPLVVTE